MGANRVADVVIVGGGIAGVSVGYFLAEFGLDVMLVEAEPTLAHHTTGRSAAQFLENYGDETVRRMSVASRPFFADPPPRFCDTTLWSNRARMRVGGPEMADVFRTETIKEQKLVPSTTFLDADETVAMLPVVRPELVGCGVIEPNAMELDVAALHQLFVRGIRHHGGAIAVSEPAQSIEQRRPGWSVRAGDETIECGMVVNAAGAWGDHVATMAGVEPIGLHPLRRTAFIARIDPGYDTSTWPLTDFENTSDGMMLYCKPESGGLLISPADETPSEPCDARPEELDVAMAIDRLNTWTTLGVRSVASSWAGLRTFTSNRSLVAGFAPGAPGFFWLTGHGGYGIQTAPGLGRTAASLIVDGRVPDDVAEIGVDAGDLSADRESIRGPLSESH